MAVDTVFSGRESLLEKEDIKVRPERTVEMRWVKCDGTGGESTEFCMLGWKKMASGRRNGVCKAYLRNSDESR